MRHLTRRLLLALGGAALVGGIVWGFLPQAPLVDLARVGRGPLRVTIEEEGRTRVKDRYLVSSPVPGFQHRIELEVGDVVSARQVLAVIEPLRAVGLDPRSRAEAQARVAAGEAAVQQAEQEARAAAAEANLAETTRERAVRLFQEGTGTRDQLDLAEARARTTAASRRSAEFAVQVARYQLEAARAALVYTSSEAPPDDAERLEVTSPVTGRVLGIRHESEGVVAAGEPLLEVGDPAALEVEVEVLSADAVQLHPGTPVLLERWGGEAPLPGVVRRVQPVGFTKISALGVEEQRVLVIVELAGPVEDVRRLGDGYRVEAVFVLWAEEDCLQVPEGALFRAPEGGWATFVVADGRVERRAVEPGRRNGLQAQVLSGLREGEAVIVHPPDAVQDGGRVRVR